MRALDHPYTLLVRLSLALALAGGFGLGLYLLLSVALRLPLPTGAPALIQAHGQMQALAFVTLFIIAVGAQLIPRFHASTLDRPRLVSVGGLLLGLGVTLRSLNQPAAPSPLRNAALVAGALLTLAGALLAVYAFSRVVRRGVEPGPRGRRAILPATLGASLLVTLLLNLVVCIQMAINGSSLVTLFWDEALLHLELWGVAGTMILLVAGNIYPRFLLLRSARESILFPALALWGFGSMSVPLVWLLLEGWPPLRLAVCALQLAGAIGYVWGLRLYQDPQRVSDNPDVTEPTRLWARVAFAFLITAAALNVWLAAVDLSGGEVTAVMLSASRHTLAQGFIMPVIVFMAARILPVYSGWMTEHPRLLSSLVWSLFVSAGLRAAGQLVGGYSPTSSTFVGLGALLAVAAFSVFAVGLWRSTAVAPMASA